MKLHLGLVFSLQVAADQCRGDRVITSASELHAIEECVEIQGSLEFRFESHVDIVLPNLVDAEDVSVRGGGVSSIRLEKLKSVGRFEVAATPRLSQLRIPKLEKAISFGLVSAGKVKNIFLEEGLRSVGKVVLKDTNLVRLVGLNAKVIDEINFERNPSMEEFLLPKLELVTGNFTFKHSHVGLKLVAPHLVRVGGDVSFNNGAFVSMEALEHVGGNLLLANLQTPKINLPVKTIASSLRIEACPHLTAVEFFQLSKVGGDFEVSGTQSLWIYSLLTVGGSFSLSRVDQKEIDLHLKSIGGSLVVKDSQKLHFLRLDSLVSVGGKVDIRGNVALESLKIGELGAIGGEILINQPILKDIKIKYPLTNDRSTSLTAMVDCTRFREAYQGKLQNLACTSTTKPGEENLTALTLW